MRKYLFVFLVMVISVCSVKAQGKAETILLQARKLVHALQVNDFDTFDKYTYPVLIDTLGGKEQYNNILQEAAESLAEQNLKLDSIGLEQPSDPIKCKNEWQCVIAESLSLTRDGKLISSYKSYLIGISSDGGANWTFMGAAVNDMDKIKATFPNICDSVAILVK